jgi:hypothetical protein
MKSNPYDRNTPMTMASIQDVWKNEESVASESEGGKRSVKSRVQEGRHCCPIDCRQEGMAAR